MTTAVILVSIFILLGICVIADDGSWERKHK